MSDKERQVGSKKPGSSLNQLFSRQQPKVKAKKNMARLLCHFAEEDHLKIARLIQTWLDKEKN